jgi:exosortase
VALTDPLQRIATLASTFALQTIGLPALADGNVILLNDVELGIVEACSGLRMLVIFFALSTAVVLVIKRRPWEKALLVASAVPIALVANVTRITVTGVLHETAGREIADAVFHDLAGWLMMPLALGLLWVELKLLSRLLLDTAPGPVRLGFGIPRRGAVPVAAPRRRPRPPARPPADVAARPAGAP